MKALANMHRYKVTRSIHRNVLSSSVFHRNIASTASTVSLRQLRIRAHKDGAKFYLYHALICTMFASPVFLCTLNYIDRDDEIIEDLLIALGAEVDGEAGVRHFNLMVGTLASVGALAWLFTFLPLCRTITLKSWVYIKGISKQRA